MKLLLWRKQLLREQPAAKALPERFSGQLDYLHVLWLIRQFLRELRSFWSIAPANSPAIFNRGRSLHKEKDLNRGQTFVCANLAKPPGHLHPQRAAASLLEVPALTLIWKGTAKVLVSKAKLPVQSPAQLGQGIWASLLQGDLESTEPRRI